VPLFGRISAFLPQKLVRPANLAKTRSSGQYRNPIHTRHAFLICCKAYVWGSCLSPLERMDMRGNTMDRNMDATAMLLDGLNTREREILERLSAGLTDQQIAAELFLSLNTVKWYNRQIYSKLGARSRTQAIAHAQALGLLGGDAGNYDGKGDTKRDAMAPAQVPTVHVALPHLPAQTTAFIGRAHQLAEVTQLLEKSRLLTLTGPGGAGKTRLALQVAAHVAETFAQGAYFVDLAPLTDPTLVASAIARSLGILENPAEPLALTLQSALAKRDLLVVIDNFEHVIEAAPLVSELLSASVALKLLVTSREPLRLTGEQQYPVPPMSLPAAAAITAGDKEFERYRCA